MLKISKVLLLLVLIAASFAGAMEKLWLGCAVNSPKETADGAGGLSTLDCYIYQGKNQPQKADYSWDEFESWNEFIGDFQGAYASGLDFDQNVYLESDIVFDGYDSTKKTCNGEAFVPFPIHSKLASFDGKNHSIKNFCMVGDQYASFFEGGNKPVTIQNVIFDGAYVELNPQSNITEDFSAAIVVNELTAETYHISKVLNVTVKNSRLQVVSRSSVEGTYYVGTIVGLSDNARQENNVVENVVISGDNKDGESSSNKYNIGGFAGKLNYHQQPDSCNIADNNLSVKIDVPFSSTLNVGGVVGVFELYDCKACGIMRNKVRPDTSVGSANGESQKLISLTASSIKQARVGGFVGEVSLSSLEHLIQGNSIWGKIQLDAATISLTGADAAMASALGGVVGYVDGQNGSIFIKGNSVVGSLNTPNLKVGSTDFFVGYVSGVFYRDLDDGVAAGNLYYSDEDINVESPIGYYGKTSNRLLNNTIDLKYNFRNAVYDEKGNALLKEYGPMKASGYVYKKNDLGAFNEPYPSAVVRASEMRQRAFANVLNGCSSNLDKKIFWEQDDSNDGLPYISDKRTVYEIKLSIQSYREPDATNPVLDEMDSLMKSFFIYADWDSLNYFVTHTDKNGYIPADFIKAYNQNIAGKYNLKLRSMAGPGYSYHTILDATKSYSASVVFDVYKPDSIAVSYDFPAGIESNLVFFPKKLETVDWRNPASVVPIVYDIENHKVYRAKKSVFSCLKLVFELDGNNNLIQVPQTEYYPIRSTNDSTWSFSQVAEDTQNCIGEEKITLTYSDVAEIDSVDGKGLNLFVGAVKDLGSKVQSAPYGYNKEGELTKIHDFRGAESDSLLRNIASELQFSIDVPGYSLDKFDVDFWVYKKGSEQVVFEECRNKGSAKGCLHIEKAPAHLGNVDSLYFALSNNSAVYWTVTLDDSKRIVMDSLAAAMSVLTSNPDNSPSDYLLLAMPKPTTTLLEYHVTFVLPENEEFYSVRPFEKTFSFNVADNESWGAFPRMVYSNDYCVAGWTTKDNKKNPPSSWDSVLTEYDVAVFESLLDTGKVNLYPIMMPAELCSYEVSAKDVESLKGWLGAPQKDGFIRVIVDEVAGAKISLKGVRLLENDPEASKDTVVHTFGASRQMLLGAPYEYEWILSYEAKDGFEAPDSMTLSYDVNRKGDELEGPYKIGSGEMIEEPWMRPGAFLSGEFKMVNQTELAFAESDIAQSGSMVRIKWETSKFAAGRDAELNVYKVDALGNVDTLKSVLVDKTPYVDSLLLPVGFGTHLVRVDLRDVLDSNVFFEKTFVVNGEIANAGKDVWQMVSLNAVNMKNVGKDDDQIFYRWDDAAEIGEFWHYLRFLPGDNVARAGGYWYSSLEGRTLKIDESFVDSIYDFKWNLENVYSGWNMVGNPHGWNVEVPDDLEMVMWDPATGDYAPNRGYLKPFEAAWVRVEKNRKVSVNGDPYFVPDSLADAAAAKKRALVKTKNAENWTIRAILADNKGKMDSWNILGMGDAQEGFEPPAGMGDIVSFAVKDGKKYLAKSVKAAPASSADSAALEWDVLLSASSDRKGKLYFEGLEGIEAYGYHLYVAVDGRTSELTAGDTLAVALKAASSTATVRVSKEKLYFRTAVEGLRMVQAGNKLNVGFTATENLDGARMVVDILDMDGKVLSTYSARAASGSNAVSLDAPKSGLYMLRVRVASQQAAGKILVK